MIGIILKYSVFYNKQVPKNPIKLLEHLPKAEIIITIAKINTLLQPRGYSNSDTTLETQIECLKAILLQDEKNISLEYQRRFDLYLEYIYRFSNKYSIFSRGSCVYALNEILQTDTFFKEDKINYTFDERIGVLDYLLVCNERILGFSNKESLSDFKKQNVDFFEFFAFNQTPYNQYNITINSLTKLYKSSFFLRTLIESDLTKEPLKKYFEDTYGLNEIDEFFRVFMFSFLEMYDENLRIYYLKISNDQEAVINILRGFSSDTPVKEVDHSDVKTLDVLSVKKNPMYSWKSLSFDDYTGFVVLDLAFLLEKMDSLLINDFWFDYLKEQSDLNRKDWGDFIGSKFFEPLVKEVFSNALYNQPGSTLKMMDELKIKINPKTEIEIADVYVRDKQKIAFFEVKSNLINMIDGYKSITTIEKFKALDMEKFSKTFGLPQMLDTIKNFHTYKNHINDENLNLTRKVHLYPIILVNEPILSSGLFNYPLRKRFESMLIHDGINIKSKEHIIWPLIIVNIEELQELEQSLSDNDTSLFKMFDSFYSKISIRNRSPHNQYKTLLTMHDIINEKIRQEKLFPKRLKDYKWTFAK